MILPQEAKGNLTPRPRKDSVVFDAFNAIQDSCPTALVFYGQDTGYKRQRPYDELGVLLPLKEFEHRLLHHLEQIDGIALACRESMFRLAGSDSLPL